MAVPVVLRGLGCLGDALMADTDLPPLPGVPEGAVVKLLGDQREKEAFERWYVTEGMGEPLGSRICHRQRLAWLARAAVAASTEPAPRLSDEAALRKTLDVLHDPLIPESNRYIRAIKEHRNLTGSTLAHAKSIVDGLRDGSVRVAETEPAQPAAQQEPTVQQCADYLRELARAARIAAVRGLGNESNEVRAQAYECAADGLLSLLTQQAQPVAPTEAEDDESTDPWLSGDDMMGASG